MFNDMHACITCMHACMHVMHRSCELLSYTSMDGQYWWKPAPLTECARLTVADQTGRKAGPENTIFSFGFTLTAEPSPFLVLIIPK